MCRASLYAGKLVWCTATHPSGVLEGVQLPMQTAVGIPFRPTSDALISIFVLYLLRRLEECPTTTNLLSQIPQLAYSCGLPAFKAAIVAAAQESPASAAATAASTPAPGNAVAATFSSSASCMSMNTSFSARGLGGPAQGVVVKQEGGRSIAGSVKTLFGVGVASSADVGACLGGLGDGSSGAANGLANGAAKSEDGSDMGGCSASMGAHEPAEANEPMHLNGEDQNLSDSLGFSDHDPLLSALHMGRSAQVSLASSALSSQAR